MGELITLSQTPESDDEGILPPYSPSFRLETQGRLILLLNWYPHFLDQSYAPAGLHADSVCNNTQDTVCGVVIVTLTQSYCVRLQILNYY